MKKILLTIIFSLTLISTTSYAFAQNFDVYRGSNRWSHSGSWVGYTAKYSRFEDLKFSTVVFCNNEAIDAGEVSDKIIEMYFNLEQK